MSVLTRAVAAAVGLLVLLLSLLWVLGASGPVDLVHLIVLLAISQLITLSQ